MSDAARQQRCRKRKAKEAVVVPPVAVPPAVVEHLIDIGYLAENDWLDRRAIREALERFLADLTRATVTP